ncbi:ABC transporter permease [Leptospira harrisiae]|uniref:Permease n=1 Tax=Leptospira harrisiae TaxID=2023189 RepID=A0A2N0AIR0_9LEPT|nr:FtsX-like permease family protein [Leptospira harrisiae]PJZ84174.1 permease [Leptospira harrisiae]PKA07911.1 permease [Leptospira harrisiae]
MKMVYYSFILGYFKDHFSKMLLSIAGISLGIALFVSTQINAWRAEQSVLDQMIGYNSENFTGRYISNHQSQGANDRFLKKVDSELPENIRIEPELQTKATYSLSENQIQSIPVVGRDILLTSTILPKKSDTNLIPKYFISIALANQLKIQSEQKTISVCDKEIQLRHDNIQILPMEGIFLVMDITRLQSICNLNNQLTSIWLIKEDNTTNIQNIIIQNSDEWTYESKEQILERAGAVLSSLKINLTIVSLVSVLISFFMVSNMFTGLYLSRKREFGILLSIGSDKKDNFFLFLTQSIVIGALGGVTGVLLGILIANTNFLTTVNTITDANQISSYRRFPFSIILLGITISMVGSILASIYNSYKTFRILPIDLIREKDSEKSFLLFGLSKKSNFNISLFSLAIGIFLGLLNISKLIVPGMIGVGFVILSFVLLNFLCLPFIIQLIDKLFSKFKFLPSLKIGLKEIQSEPWKHGLTASTIMLSSSLVFTLTSLTESYEHSVVRWVDEENKSDFSLISEKKLSSGDPGVPISLLETLTKDTNFTSVEPFYIDSKFIVNGKYYTLHVFDFPKQYKKDELITSTNLCFLDQICKGDLININTDLNSNVPIKIQATKDHFFSERGTIMMDYTFFQKNYKVKFLNSIRITRNKEKPMTDVLTHLSNISKKFDLKYINQEELKKLYLEGMKKVFSILDTLKISALIISILTLSTSLVYFIREKSQMLAGLKSIGMDSFQMFLLIYYQALFLVSFGIFSGILNSLILSPIVIFGINRNAFGWILDYQYPLSFVVKLPIIIPAITFLICLLPFYFLNQMKISKELKYE